MANNEELKKNTERTKEIFDELLFASRDFTKEVKEASKNKQIKVPTYVTKASKK